MEKREISRLRTEIGSLKLGLETANKQLDVQAKQQQLQELHLKDAEDKKSWAEQELEREKGIEQELQRELESCKHQLQQALLKDPLLADQIRVIHFFLLQPSSFEEKMGFVLRMSYKLSYGNVDAEPHCT